MCTLDIIIPQYKEPDYVIERLLKSIQNQENINFECLGIIIVNDCSDMQVKPSLIQRFPKLKITLLRTPKNVGPGLARQYGIDHSSADYITFLDADDMYYSTTSFQKIFELLQTKRPTIILTKWMEEIHNENGSHSQILHTSDIIFLHGKVIKRSYLIEKEITFSSKLKLHEDSFFCTILLLCTTDILHTDIILNYWRYNSNSLVRSKKAYHYLVRTFEELLTCNKEVIRELEKRNHPFKKEYTIKAIVYLYCILASHFFDNLKDKKLQSLKQNYEFLFYNFLTENLELFSTMEQNKIVQYMNEQIRMFITTNSTLGLKESWSDFIMRLTNQYEKE